MNSLVSTTKKTIKVSLAALTATLLSCGGSLPDEETPSAEGSSNSSSSAPAYSIEEALEIVAKENDVARKLYTKGIVGPGKANGLKFDEDWRKDGVDAGPLPALFLRGISSHIQKTEVPLGLFLGSNYPINSANEFKGRQAELFKEIKKTEKPEFFYDEESQLQTAMFPDFAAAAPCVNCHNDHPDTKKDDWVLGDVMGATTWTYPKDSVTFEELQGMIMAYRNGAKATLEEYHDKIGSFGDSPKPEIGDKWPSEGLFVPSPEAFLDSVQTLVGSQTLAGILKI